VLTKPRVSPAYQSSSVEELFADREDAYGIVKPLKPMCIELDCIEDRCVVTIQNHTASGYHSTVPGCSVRLPLVPDDEQQDVPIVDSRFINHLDGFGDDDSCLVDSKATERASTTSNLWGASE
jgi:hypothetical protein